MDRTQDYDNPIVGFGWKTTVVLIVGPYFVPVLMFLLSTPRSFKNASTLPYDLRIALLIGGIAFAVLWTFCWIFAVVKHLRFKWKNKSVDSGTQIL